MKRSGKIMLGLFTVAALVGTGYATWVINDGFAGAEITADSTIDTQINNSNFAKLEVVRTPGDGKLRFGADDVSKLNAKFDVKAIALHDGIDIFNPDTFKDVVNKPDLHITVTPLRNGEALSGLEKENFDKYVTYEPMVIGYQTWLLEAGYTVDYHFAWNKTLFGEQTPSQYFGQMIQGGTEAVNTMNAALKDVVFKFTFQVGAYQDYTPKTGHIELPVASAGEKFSIADYKDNSLTAGTHRINLAVPSDKGVEGNKLRVNWDAGAKQGVDAVTLETSDLKPAGGQEVTYTNYHADYDFKQGYKYTFDYALVDKLEPVTFATSEYFTIEETQDSTATFVGDTLKFTVTPTDGYELTENSVKVNGEPAMNMGDHYEYITKQKTNHIEAAATKIIVKASVTIKAPAVGSVAIENKTEDDLYAVDTVLNLTHTDVDHYRFVTYTADGKDIEGTTYTVAGPEAVVISARYEAITGTVTLADGITADKTSGTEGDTITLDEYTAPKGYEFVKYQVTVGGTTTDVTGNTFVLKEGENKVSVVTKAMVVEVPVTGNGSITRVGEGDILYGEDYKFKVTVNDGYKLTSVNWKGEAVALEADPEGVYTHKLGLTDENGIEIKTTAVTPDPEPVPERVLKHTYIGCKDSWLGDGAEFDAVGYLADGTEVELTPISLGKVAGYDDNNIYEVLTEPEVISVRALRVDPSSRNVHNQSNLWVFDSHKENNLFYLDNNIGTTEGDGTKYYPGNFVEPERTYYTLDLTEVGENVTVTTNPNVTKFDANLNVEITVNVTEGYELKTLTLDGEDLLLNLPAHQTTITKKVVINSNLKLVATADLIPEVATIDQTGVSTNATVSGIPEGELVVGQQVTISVAAKDGNKLTEVTFNGVNKLDAAAEFVVTLEKTNKLVVKTDVLVSYVSKITFKEGTADNKITTTNLLTSHVDTKGTTGIAATSITGSSNGFYGGKAGKGLKMNGSSATLTIVLSESVNISKVVVGSSAYSEKDSKKGYNYTVTVGTTSQTLKFDTVDIAPKTATIGSKKGETTITIKCNSDRGNIKYIEIYE